MLDGKVIVVTGGSLGIGLAVAEKCVKEGAEVIISSRNENHLSDALSQLNTISGKKHQSYVLDVSDLETVKGFGKWCHKEFGEINGLVNCAGIYGPIGKTPNVDMKLFAEAINVNFLGAVYVCSVFASLPSSRTRKKIIMYSGGGAAGPFANYSAYAASKAAVVRFTENLAIELSDDGFDVNCIAPGFVVTRLHDQTIQAGPKAAGVEFYDNTLRQIESGGCPPEKAANLTAFLLSEQSDGITGKFISAPWDPWSDEVFQKALRDDKDFATLRRIDNKFFMKV
jgi:NAD(P)-dependent dehydrogenase (short-subunit alcohol dehydrogenase family)